MRRWRGEAAVVLAAGDLEAVFLPEVGMLGASLRLAGEEFLSLEGGIAAYRRSHVTGLPLLAPWANRLSARRFRVAGRGVDLEGLPLHTDEHGLPIHGTMSAVTGWTIAGLGAGDRSARLLARFAYDERRPDLLAVFPFPHLLEVDVTLSASALRVRTTLSPMGEPVPVAFGWHPYFRLPVGRRDAWLLSMPPARHLKLDGRGIPTGESEPLGAARAPLGERVFDDLFALGADRRFGLEGAGRRLAIRFDDYPFAQVYAPPGSPFVAIEPMTAATDALVSGRCPVTLPGERWSAAFRVAPGRPPSGAGRGPSLTGRRGRRRGSASR